MATPAIRRNRVDRKQFGCLDIVLNYKTGHYFWNSVDGKSRFSFSKR